jgi:hypothetical protein
MRRRRHEEGSFSAEFLAALPILVVVVLLGVQFIAVVSAGNAAAAAARNGSRAISVEQDHEPAVRRSLPGWLADDPRITRSGTRVEVEVRVPPVVPGVPFEGFRVSRAAELPATP